MFLSELRSKYFWIFIAAGSVIGAIVGSIMSYNKDRALEKAAIKYCYEYRGNMVYPGIQGIEDLSEADEYISYFARDESKDYQYRFTVIDQGQKVYVLDSTSHFPLVEIFIQYDQADKVHGSYDELWIWHEFLFDRKMGEEK